MYLRLLIILEQIIFLSLNGSKKEFHLLKKAGTFPIKLSDFFGINKLFYKIQRQYLLCQVRITYAHSIKVRSK